MSRDEKRAGAALASIFALRMLGLFLILPVFAVHARSIPGGDDLTLVGIALGAYGLTQAIFQIPFGMASDAFGRKRVIVFGGLTAAAGLLLATLAPAWEAALVGYALVGAGCSNIVPVLYTAVGKQTVMPESIAVPAITTLGYAGILAGPAVIGFIAHGSSLSIAFALIAVMLLGVAASGKVLKV